MAIPSVNEAELARLRAELTAFVLDEAASQLASHDAIWSAFSNRIASDLLERVPQELAVGQFADLVAARIVARFENSDASLLYAPAGAPPDQLAQDHADPALEGEGMAAILQSHFSRPWMIALALLAAAALGFGAGCLAMQVRLVG